jgi:hypothetical protein
VSHLTLVDPSTAFVRQQGAERPRVVADLAAAREALKAGSDLDALVVLDTENFGTIMRALEPLTRRGVLIVPADADAIVDPSLRTADAMYAAWHTTQDANYVARCALRGHYLEFGTWYGRSFFSNYYRYRHWLNGRFYAFDSFAGLSEPLPLETEYTGGDFYAGGYACNQRSFEAIADIVDMPRERLRVVPGFFYETLRRSPKEYGIAPGSAVEGRNR